MPAAKPPDAPLLPQPSFEEDFRRLEEIVTLLDKVGLPLEQLEALFAEGITLAGRCTERLNAVEQKVELLLKNAENQFERRPLDAS